MANRWPVVALGDVAPIQRRPVETAPGNNYPLLAVRSFGRGTFCKPPLQGEEITWQKLFQVRAGDLLFSNIKAWEGAVAVVAKDDDGRYCSHRYITCVADEARVLPTFLGYYFRTPQAVWQLEKASPGSADRNRTLRMAALERIPVPLPPLDEQRRIVARLNRVEQLVKDVHAEKARISAESHALVSSLHFAFSTGADRQLREFLKIDEDRVPTEASLAYPQVGVRGFAGGLFKKDAVTGADTSYKHFNRLREGLFLVSQPKGWEGAVAVCGAEYDGWFASPEYRTFSCVPGKLHPEYLQALLPTTWFQTALAKLTRGQGARRERLRPEMLLAMPVRMPPWEKQLEAINVLKRIKSIGALDASLVTRVDALLPAMLHEIFGT